MRKERVEQGECLVGRFREAADELAVQVVLLVERMRQLLHERTRLVCAGAREVAGVAA